MSELLHVLQIEDCESDAALVVRILEKAGYEVVSERVEEAREMQEALAAAVWDVIIADYRLPLFDAPSALRLLHESGRDIPFIVVSGGIGEDLAVAMMKSGAHDYLMKSNLARLAPAVAREIREARARRERRRAEERLALAVEATHLGTFDFDSKSGEFICSGLAKRQCGLPEDATVSYEMFLSAVHPGDRERVHDAVRSALQSKGGGRYAAEYRTGSAGDRAERWLSAWGRAFFDGAGRPVRFIGMTLDVTERKRAESMLRARAEELEAVMDAVPVATLISRDPECRHLTGSRMTYDLFRVPYGANLSKSADEHERPRSYRILKNGIELHPEDLPVQTVARTGEPLHDYEFDLVFKDGTCRNMFGNTVPLLDESGRSRGAVAGFLDVTERKRIDERLREAQKIASIGVLASGVAHDFNNILTGVSGNISLAIEDLPPESQALPLLETAIGSVRSAAALTRQLLAYAGKGAFVREAVQVSEVAEETLQLLRSSLPPEVSIAMNLASELPAVVMDRSQLQQIFMNLVLNAGEAIGDRPGNIIVSTGSEGRSVYIEVRDSGCGMDRKTQEQIFDPFFTTKLLGRGLGLAAVQGIVRSLNGEISVDSEPGRGTRIRVLLPAAQSPPAMEPPRETHTPDNDRCGVLIVDDEPAIRKLASALLRRRGIPVFEASNGREAIECLAATHGIQAVVLDITMPELHGDAALPAIRELRPDIQVIISSGYSDTEVREYFRAMNVAGFLPKPYTGDQLLAHILPALTECASGPS
jgi:PAS domain S-box-containing protein